MITDTQRANLAKLAAYLRTLPVDYPDFAMSQYAKDGRGLDYHEAHLPECGTAACACGHGPAAGIMPLEFETWGSYSYRAFVPEVNFSAWDWCFSGAWSRVDNTAHGAAMRIEWLLANGLPEDAELQEEGAAPLCYRTPADTTGGGK